MKVVLPPGTKISTRNANALVFELPDMQHECTVYVYTNLVYMSITCTSNINQRCESYNFDKRKVSMAWEDLVQTFIESAVRKYPKPIRHGSVTVERIRRGF
jgi:hypothetical protein